MSLPFTKPNQLIVAILFVAVTTSNLRGEGSSPEKGDDAKSSASAKVDTSPISEGDSDSSGGTGGEEKGDGGAEGEGSKKPEHTAVLKDAKHIRGLIDLYQKENQLFAELKSADYNKDLIVLISIARGIGRDPLFGGMTWGFGDDWVWSFRKVDKRVYVTRKNVRFKAEEGTPEATALRYAYTDSVLFSLPIRCKGPGGGDLVDFTQIFMSDLPQISQVLDGFVFSAAKSSWASVKGFKDNVEIQVAATYASGGASYIESVADTRGVTINVHYSISRLPETGYKSRLADDRIGYFLTVRKDYSKKTDDDRFVRYINRWDLQKADSDSSLSPPKEPIVFWLENTIPYQYRKTVREGILEWNKAFEEAGFANAIEVRQQPDDAQWDPEDVNYNTFRWITSSAGFAMGPSRVNPYTGQILDADIIFDADFIQSWQREFELFTPETVAAMTGGPLDIASYESHLAKVKRHPRAYLQQCIRQQAMARQFAFGETAMAAADPKIRGAEMEKMILQGLKGTVMHEVGHTLGLRHNFKSSTYKDLEEINAAADSDDSALISSVMDYDAVNIAPRGEKQGNYFTRSIGPYDTWAIQYGYTSLSGGTDGEKEKLDEIAKRSGEPGLIYATDEDTRGIDPDPLSNRHDLGKDPIKFAKRQVKLVQDLIPTIVDEMTKEGEDYVKARRAFNVLLAQHGSSLFFASRFVGGLHLSRTHKGDNQAQPPVKVVSAEKQREALELLEEQVFSDKPFSFSPEILNYLGPSRWNHWGTEMTMRPDFPLHEVIMMWQSRILDQVLSSLTLTRLHDSELKVTKDEKVITIPELLSRLTNSIFAEAIELKDGEYTDRTPAIRSLRRNLQRHYMKRLANVALGNTAAPEDCQTVAYAELKRLASQIEKTLKDRPNLDPYSSAHLDETATRIQKILEARVTQFAP